MIRLASKKDIDILASFQVLMAKETEDLKLDPVTVRKGVAAVFNNPAKGFYLVTEEEGEVVASLMITYEWSDWRAKTTWWIQSLYVKPEARKKGVYRAMYEYLKKKVEEDDSVGGIRLYVDKGNVKAQKAYEALGMDGEHYFMYEYMK